jgi:hypothetical protein
VGEIYMLKLDHMVADAMHARSTGPYSPATQQPVSSRSHFGGQHFGEMEMYALEAYGAAHTLQEMMTVKSDDVDGRRRTNRAIVKGETLPEPSMPESVHVLVKGVEALGIRVTMGHNTDDSLDASVAANEAGAGGMSIAPVPAGPVVVDSPSFLLAAHIQRGEESSVFPVSGVKNGGTGTTNVEVRRVEAGMTMVKWLVAGAAIVVVLYLILS